MPVHAGAIGEFDFWLQLCNMGRVEASKLRRSGLCEETRSCEQQCWLHRCDDVKSGKSGEKWPRFIRILTPRIRNQARVWRVDGQSKVP